MSRRGASETISEMEKLRAAKELIGQNIYLQDNIDFWLSKFDVATENLSEGEKVKVIKLSLTEELTNKWHLEVQEPVTLEYTKTWLRALKPTENHPTQVQYELMHAYKRPGETFVQFVARYKQVYIQKYSPDNYLDALAHQLWLALDERTQLEFERGPIPQSLEEFIKTGTEVERRIGQWNPLIKKQRNQEVQCHQVMAHTAEEPPATFNTRQAGYDYNESMMKTVQSPRTNQPWFDAQEPPAPFNTRQESGDYNQAMLRTPQSPRTIQPRFDTPQRFHNSRRGRFDRSTRLASPPYRRESRPIHRNNSFHQRPPLRGKERTGPPLSRRLAEPPRGPPGNNGQQTGHNINFTKSQQAGGINTKNR